MRNSKPTVPELEEILRPLQTALAEANAKLGGLADKLAPFQKYDESADVRIVASEIGSYHEQVSRVLNGDMEVVRDKWNLF